MTVNSIKDIMGAFFSTLAEDEQDQVWKNFLVEKGLNPNLTPTTAPSTYVGEFVGYAQAVYDRLLTQYNLSPDEVKKRQIMFMVFDLSLTMLKAIQNSIAVTANNMIISSKWQEEYTKMLTRVPIYTANPTENMRIDLTDPTKCTFGYNDINLQDIAQYLVNQADLSVAAAGGTAGAKEVNFGMEGSPDTTTSKTFTYWYNPQDQGTRIYRTITYSNFNSQCIVHIDPATGTGYVEIKGTAQVLVKDENNQTTYNGNYTLTDYKETFTYTPSTSPETFAKTVKNVTTAALATLEQAINLSVPSDPVLNSYTNNLNPDEQFQFYFPGGGNSVNKPFYNGWGFKNSSGNPLTPQEFTFKFPSFFVPWRYKQPWTAEETGSDETKKAANKEAESNRAETNSLLQQYLESIRARRQTIRDRATTMQSSLDQTRESMSQQSNLLTSIVDTMKDLIGSIFR